MGRGNEGGKRTRFKTRGTDGKYTGFRTWASSRRRKLSPEKYPIGLPILSARSSQNLCNHQPIHNPPILIRTPYLYLNKTKIKEKLTA